MVKFLWCLWLGVFIVCSGARIRLKRAATDNLHGTTITGYYVTVKLGNPPQELNVIVDTGSSNFAVAGGPNPVISNFYNKSSSNTSVDTGVRSVKVDYTEGWWMGDVVSDVLSVPSAQLDTSVRVPVADITNSNKFFVNGSNWVGILGLAYSDLVLPKGNGLKSVMHEITHQTSTPDLLSMQLCSTSLQDATYGALLIGEIDLSLAAGPLYWTPIVKQWYYDIIVSGLKIGDKVVDIDCSDINYDRTIVDSGTTNLRFPQKVYDIILPIIKASVVRFYFDQDFYDGKTMFCTTDPAELYGEFPNITIYLPSTNENQTIELTIHSASIPQFTTMLDASKQSCYKFAIFPSAIGTVLGTVLMEEYYVVFNRINSSIGFALSACHKGSTIQVINKWINSTNCRYIPPTKPITYAAYVVLALFCICLLPLCFLLAFNYFRSKSTPCRPRESYDQLDDHHEVSH
uniref:Peptidase A1 domain-containing protein n=1 Tax=Ciona savignyi TaxID=51511 RepID=H2YF12_CIOSA